MGTMNISLPDTLKSFVDEQVVGRGYGTSSEYVRELIRKDRDRQRLRRLLFNGAESAPDVAGDAGIPADEELQKFASVHASIGNHFNLERHLIDRLTCRARRSAALAE
ncbi:MAG: type II toxin-antitoxin system ParD family antitoxin [Sphingomonas bacterium]